MGSPYTLQHSIDHWNPAEHGCTTDFYDAHYVENGQTHHYDGNATDLWTEKAIDFLHNHTDSEQPFFMFLSYNAQYGDGFAIGGEPKNPFGKRFEDKSMDSLPREPISKRNIDYVMRWSAVDLPGSDFSDNLTA